MATKRKPTKPVKAWALFYKAPFSGPVRGLLFGTRKQARDYFVAGEKVARVEIREVGR